MEQTDDDKLDEILENAGASTSRRSNSERQGSIDDCGCEAFSPENNDFDFVQWSIGSNGYFRPSRSTRKMLSPGVYTFDKDCDGIIIKSMKIITDNLIELPDNSIQKLLSSMEKFWNIENRYRKYGLLYRRGILLWGPPGSGKTACLNLLSNYLIKNEGLVIICYNPAITSAGLELLRKIEPDRHIICILEDIDEMIDKYGEHNILSLLDGENKVENICNIATTNYPERLGARIVNRPSRFDERLYIGMPSENARRVYLKNIIGDVTDLEKWVVDTNQLSIAHIRELAAAVNCLDQPYDEVLNRLQKMKIKMSGRDESFGGKTGF